MREAVTGDGLTQRERRYVEGRSRGMNGIAAVTYAGYTGSENTLHVRAAKLKKHPKIIAALERTAAGEGLADSVELPAPQPGPQTALADCVADLAIFGGAAGGGKSWGLLFEPVKWATWTDGQWCLPGAFRGVIFRRTNPELVGGGGLWDESQTLYRPLGAKPRRSPSPDWIFPGHNGIDARIELRHLATETDINAHQGRQYAYVGFDELTHFTERQFWYLVSRLRTLCGIRPYLRASCNPDPDSFVKDLIGWWLDKQGYPILERSGVLRWFVREEEVLRWYDSEEEARAAHPDGEPMSLTFIASRLSDNQVLVKADPGYRARLMAMTRVDRARLLGDETRGGNWNTRSAAGMVFRREEVKLTDEPPPFPVVATVRFWDKGASEVSVKYPNPDWTRGVRVSLCEGMRLWIDDVVSTRSRGVDVLGIMRATAELDTVLVTVGTWQDSGGAGATDVNVSAAALAGFPLEVIGSHTSDTTGISGTHKSSAAKRAFASAWAPWVKRGDVYVKRGQPWTNDLLAELDGFPDARFDDIVDAISGAFQVLVGGGFGWFETIKAGAAAARETRKR